MEDMGEGETTATLAQSLRLLGLRPGAKKERHTYVCVGICVCVCVYANERVRGSLCACKRTCLFQDHYTLCMYAYFCKKEKKMEKNLNNKCFICFKKIHTQLFTQMFSMSNVS